MSQSFVLSGATVVDGTGQTSLTGDVMIQNDTIAAVSRISLEDGTPRIDCRDTNGTCRNNEIEQLKQP